MAGPLNYLIQIGHVELLPRMFERVAIPSMVHAELSHPLGPPLERLWIQEPPSWLEIQNTTRFSNVTGLDAGETDAIALAISLHADLLLIDLREGFRVGVAATGILGVLDLGADPGLVDFASAIFDRAHARFRRPTELLCVLLAKYAVRRDS